MGSIQCITFFFGRKHYKSTVVEQISLEGPIKRRKNYKQRSKTLDVRKVWTSGNPIEEPPSNLLSEERPCQFIHLRIISFPPSVFFPVMGWLLWYLAAAVAVASGSERTQHQVQHGPCSYTFILPEVEQCRPAGDFQVTNSLQRDSPPQPPHAEPTWQERKLESLESATENNTQWLQKVVTYLNSPQPSLSLSYILRFVLYLLMHY